MSFWCIASDPCGICCVALTYTMILYADYVVVFELLLPWLGLSSHCCMLILLFLAISALALSSHARTMLTNPGAVPLEYHPPEISEPGSLPMCSRCNGYKPPRAHHCSQCDRCIMKMDHHCPWVNNCVGANNQKHFVLFVGYTALLSTMALALLLARIVAAPKTDSPKRDLYFQSTEPTSSFLYMCLLFFEALLFGLFTLAMLCEQFSSIISDETGIERLKHDYTAPQRSALANLSETFGRPVSLLWLLPTAVRFHGLSWWDLMPTEHEV
uniref:Palmitoyltransferase n=1 Tax=Chrysotila carterae TaxID=13221 RepID=A0A7S4BTR0_CHRCT|mmetsp:Transcript_5941/g.13027  ORF Transcript_5941/g.13027 Transcript_5941/m.13027 type:complete len:270 (+) Transcript_5941:281-1090(+)